MQGFQGMKEGLGCASPGSLTEPKPWNSGPGPKVSVTCCVWGKGAAWEARPAGPLHSCSPGVPGSHRDTELVVGGLCKGFQVMLEIAS